MFTYICTRICVLDAIIKGQTHDICNYIYASRESKWMHKWHLCDVYMYFVPTAPNGIYTYTFIYKYICIYIYVCIYTSQIVAVEGQMSMDESVNESMNDIHINVYRHANIHNWMHVPLKPRAECHFFFSQTRIPPVVKYFSTRHPTAIVFPAIHFPAIHFRMTNWLYFFKFHHTALSDFPAILAKSKRCHYLEYFVQMTF